MDLLDYLGIFYMMLYISLNLCILCFLFRATLVKGKYPEPLLKAWDTYDGQFRGETENIRPGIFGENQCYMILLLGYGGVDLEHTAIKTIHQAFSILRQICIGIIYAQKVAFSFDHFYHYW